MATRSRPSTASSRPVNRHAMMELRPVAAPDRPFLLDVYASTREEELTLVPWTPEEKQQFVETQFTAQDRYYHERYPDAAYDLILVDDRPAGRLYVRRLPDRIHIIDIALLPNHRRRGLGTRLIAQLQREAQSRGVPLSVNVERFSPALKLYYRLDFNVVKDGGAYLFMEWAGPA